MKADSREAILADVESFCQELRPLEELCYLEHRYNDELPRMAHRHGLLGIPIPVE